MTLLPYQQRVVEEKAELDEKIGRLRVYIASPAFSAVYAAEQDRMQEQLAAMSNYSFILGERIKAFQ